MSSDECTCSLRPDMSYDELVDEILIPEKYCTSLKMSGKGWICENFQKALEAARVKSRYQSQSKKAAKQRKIQKAKQLAAAGLPKDKIIEQLKAMKPSTRRSKSKSSVKLSKTNFGSF